MAMPITGKMNYLQLVRWKNVLMVAATIALTWYCLLMPFHKTESITHFGVVLPLLIVASSLIAAGGYVINDIYDTEIDKINKPTKVIIGKHVSETKAWRIYIILTFTGAVAGIYLAMITQSFLLGLFFFMIIGLLWIYSAILKKKFISGNLLIAFLSATTVLVPMAVFFLIDKDTLGLGMWVRMHQTMGYFVLGYALFAFITHFVRELVKDIEDTAGDKLHQSTTIPIVMGEEKAVIIAQVLNAFILLGAVIVQIILFISGFYLLAGIEFAVIALILLLMIKLRKAEDTVDFNRVGNISKLLMLIGILSMGAIPIMI